MIQIIPENRKQSTMDRFGQAFANLGQSVSEGIPQLLMGQHQAKQQQHQAEKLSQLIGFDVSGYAPEMQQKLAEMALKPRFENQAELEFMRGLGLDFSDNQGQENQDFNQMPSQNRSQPKGILSEEFGGAQPHEEAPSRKSTKSSMKLIPQNKIDAMSLHKPALADKWQRANDNIIKQEMHNESFAQKERELADNAARAIEKDKRNRFESDRDFNTKFSFPVIEAATNEAKNLPIQKSALLNMRDAIKRGDDVGFMSPDWWADFTNVQSLRTMTGAQLQNAGKEFLMSSIGRAGSRPNQWIEQRILSMTPEVGKNKFANETYYEGLAQEMDLKEAWIKEVQRLQQEDFKNEGFGKADIGLRASQNIEPYVKERQDIAKYRMQDIYEREHNIQSVEDLKTVLPGTPLTTRVASILKQKFGKNAPEAAKRLGYEFTPKEIILKAQQQ